MKRRLYKPDRLASRYSKKSKTARGQNKSLKQARALSRLFLYVFFILSLAWFCYFFFVSDNFSIKTINIAGIKNIPEREIRQIIKNNFSQKKLLFFPYQNIFIFSKNKFRDQVRTKYIVEDVIIDKKFPFTLNINIEEKLARLILKAQNQILVDETVEESPPQEAVVESEEKPLYNTSLFFIDVNGIVVSKEETIADEFLASLPIIEINLDSQTLVNPGDVIFTREQINYVFALYEEVASSRTNIQIEKILADLGVADEFKVVTSESWQVFLNMDLSVQTQLKKLELALEEKIGDSRPSLQYVDLRVPDRVYYK